MKHAPFALDLEEELNAQTRMRRTREKAESSGGSAAAAALEARPLSGAEALRVRKILACAARMQGRFGKGLLAATLRGSRSGKIVQAGLKQLSTYGILGDMTQDEILLYIDALISAGCLTVAGGAYPTVSLTDFGGEVMRERASVQLALPASPAVRSAATPPPAPVSSFDPGRPVGSDDSPAPKRVNTVEETYALYQEGLSIEEISERRGLTEITVEKHLADCILEGRPFDVSRHVSEADRAAIEIAVDQLGTERLKTLRDALPRHITYRMIRFVVAEMQRADQHLDAEQHSGALAD
jgi:superfamily II DNA helicase RecQ